MEFKTEESVKTEELLSDNNNGQDCLHRVKFEEAEINIHVKLEDFKWLDDESELPQLKCEIDIKLEEEEPQMRIKDEENEAGDYESQLPELKCEIDIKLEEVELQMSIKDEEDEAVAIYNDM